MSDDESLYSTCSSSSSLVDASDEPTLRTLIYEESQKFLNCFHVCHLNAQSIPQHHTELLDTFSSSAVHAILISESWFKPELSSTSYSLPDHILLRNDRTGKRGGGVAIYLRSDLPYTILKTSSSLYSGSMEYIFLEVNVKSVKVFLGVVYCPPQVDYFSDLEENLLPFSSAYSHHIIMGDFNTDLLGVSLKSCKLRSTMMSHNFTILPLNATHRNFHSADTWIDLMAVSSVENVVNYRQFPASGFSRHDLLFLSYKLKSPKPLSVSISIRSLARLDIDKLKCDADAINWSSVYTASSIDEKVDFFNSNILGLYNEHAPKRVVRLKRPPVPWITTEVRKAMAKRDRKFRAFKKNRTDIKWQAYKAARNRCNQMVRAAKRRYIHEQVLNSSSADIWKFLNTLGYGKSQFDYNSFTYSPDDFNRHFLSPQIVSDNSRANAISFITSTPPYSHEIFTFSPVDEDEVHKALSSIKSKAIGCDDVSRVMVLHVLDTVLPVITHIINFSLTNGAFPTLWRKAFIIPIPKSTDCSAISNFRPISILPFLSKVLEAVAHKQISSFVFSKNILSPYQSGFRPGHSTTTALLKVTEDIREGMEKSKLTVLILIDFSNAFNSVDHDILLALLSHLNISSSAQEWFSSYLRGRQQAVRTGHMLSDWCDVSTGVPQGGIISPLLFSIFINLITLNLKCSYHLYADDLQLYAQAEPSDIINAISLLNDDLKYISEWSTVYGINVNPSKCQAIILGSPRLLSKLDVPTLPSIKFNNNVIPFSPHVKNLGLYVDCRLTWNKHIQEVSRKTIGTLRSLYRLKNFLPTNTKILLVQSLILPIIDYVDVCCSDLSQHHLNTLDRLLNNCIRYIYGLRKYDHVSSFRDQLNWLPIRQRRNVRILCTLFSILNDPCAPEYLKSKFQYLGDSHNCSLRSSANLKLLTPLHRTGFLSHSFALTAIRLWNDIPLDIKKAPNKLVFKNRVRKHVGKIVASLN